MREDLLLLLQVEGDVSNEEQIEKRREGDELGCDEFDDGRELKMVEEFELFLGCPFHGKGDSLLGSSCSFSVKNWLWILDDDGLDSRKTSSVKSMLGGVMICSLSAVLFIVMSAALSLTSVVLSQEKRTKY